MAKERDRSGCLFPLAGFFPSIFGLLVLNEVLHHESEIEAAADNHENEDREFDYDSEPGEYDDNEFV